MVPIRAVCSCGKETDTHYDEKLNAWLAEDKEWRFRNPAFGIKIGWYCGNPEHYAADAFYVYKYLGLNAVVPLVP